MSAYIVICLQNVTSEKAAPVPGWHEAVALRPEPRGRFVLCSSEPLAQVGNRASPDERFLLKPFEMKTLWREVEGIIQRREPQILRPRLVPTFGARDGGNAGLSSLSPAAPHPDRRLRSGDRRAGGPRHGSSSPRFAAPPWAGLCRRLDESACAAATAGEDEPDPSRLGRGQVSRGRPLRPPAPRAARPPARPPPHPARLPRRHPRRGVNPEPVIVSC